LIKNIIFDLGGVIYDLNHGLTQVAFQNLGIPGIDQNFSHAGQSTLFDRLEIGIMSPQEFRRHICNLSQKQIADQDIDAAFNAMLIGFNHPEYFEYLKALKVYYNTFLLSNNNAIHYDFVMKDLVNMIGEKTLSPFFHKTYYSHMMHLRKPDPAIFEAVLSEQGLQPEETLFIEDTLVHIQSAKNLGIKTYLKKQEENLIEILNKILGEVAY
jgi:glucose-1-phosphatase